VKKKKKKEEEKKKRKKKKDEEEEETFHGHDLSAPPSKSSLFRRVSLYRNQVNVWGNLCTVRVYECIWCIRLADNNGLITCNRAVCISV
jgi:hypothetical protein